MANKGTLVEAATKLVKWENGARRRATSLAAPAARAADLVLSHAPARRAIKRTEAISRSHVARAHA